MKCRLIPSFIILIPFLILVTGCSESPSIFKDQELTLDVDAEVTETWITLSSNPLKRKATYIVQRDTTIIFEGRLHSADTLIHDTGLEPATAYSYTAWDPQRRRQQRTDQHDCNHHGHHKKKF